ncbi:MAG: lipoyl synthase [Gammaproteobacteria bacterium]|nr:lipoyl synthase [Gammaproteobacteria bacterium]MBJ55823.1 lipoyl synthase [Gammaproteobacteria bacterium]HBN14769.1 lipoyl synthase [Pseudohongiella sp.]|tara:strand:+ start:249 stop:1331 length:1083 start_codon:yes stop_codon:yes gene_type:complete
MSSNKRPPSIPSGSKFRSEHGIAAIKDGIKASSGKATVIEPTQRKPQWLRARMPGGERFDAVRQNVREHKLSTVCEESHCPNIGECWNNGTATIMVMGSVCTRACRFCAVDTGNPNGWLDKDEPAHVAESVELMGLRYIVLTSVDRDDLDDGGAAHYAACVAAIKQRTPQVVVEALTPDFGGNLEAVARVVDSGLEVFAQNVETVERLTHPVRDPRAGYQRTLDVLAFAKQHRPDVLTKTSLMLGLGETDEEILQTMDDLRAINVDILTLGQYLQPTRNHLKVERFVTPEAFRRYREIGLEKGFMEVASGPLVRSSYRADRVFEKNNLGIPLPDMPEVAVAEPAADATQADGRIPLTQIG